MEPSDYTEILRAKLAALPTGPGCYLFKDAEGQVLYVGKAKSLRSRARSYFAASPTDERAVVPLLRRRVRDVETVVTSSEKEAAVLENELIKRHQPRFNVKLRDDKDFLCLRLDLRADWPRLDTVRRPSADGARYFGPYHSATAARRTLRLVNKHFQLRTCSDAELGSRSRPCLQYQIQRCPGPCVYPVDRSRYLEQAHAVELFLAGRHDELSTVLRQRMAAAAAAMDYERAALHRDQLRAVESVRESQRVVAVRSVDQDVVGLHRELGLSEIVVLFVRQGHVTDSCSFSLGRSELPDEEIVAGFVGHYYGEVIAPASLPDELVLPLRLEAVSGIEQWLGERRGRRLRMLVPRSGPRRRLIELATENAAHAFREKRRASDDLEERLEDLRTRLRLPAVPRTIEFCDISHLGGGDTMGAIVCLHDGEPDKKRYRSFRVRTTEGGDDYAAIYEVLGRRFRRGREGEGASSSAPSWELPDLLVVDGGRGQLGVALTAARDLGLHELCIVALAKERESLSGETLVDRVYLPGQKNGILAQARHSAFALLLRGRDEAHRFANRGRERAGTKRRLQSALGSIAGIGPKAEKALLRALGSFEAVRAASDAQILAVPGVSPRHLTALRKVVATPAVPVVDATPTPP
jgi:excinuclease ABC subunit C